MNESKFIEEFMTYYNDCGEYDITIAFELFYDQELVNKDRIEELFEICFPDKNIEIDEQLLYDKLYNIVEAAVVNDCESEAETDEEG